MPAPGPRLAVDATKFIGTYISANGLRYDQFKYVPDYPHVRSFDSRLLGHAAADISAARMTTSFRAVSDVRDPKATVGTLKWSVAKSGRAGAISF